MGEGIIYRTIDIAGTPGRPEGLPSSADLSGVGRMHLDLAYADASDAQTLDLFLPADASGPFPLIIHIHGGAFMMCDKRDAQVQPWLGALDRGYAVATINYRMSGEALFPAAVHDCKCAVRWLRAHSDEYSLDPDRFAAVGESAGGHLAAMLAVAGGASDMEDLSQGNPEQPSNVQACVDMFGPTDFLKMDEQLGSLGLGPLDHNDADSPESRYMGGRITDLDPEWMRKSNPLAYVNDGMPPILIQHGDRDHLVCVLQSKIFYDAIAGKLGPERVVFEVLEGADHADIHFETDENMARVFAFLDEHLKGWG